VSRHFSEDPYEPPAKVRSMTAVATTARAGHRFDASAPTALSAHHSGGWRDPSPLSPLVLSDESRQRQETVWSGDRECAHQTQETVRRTATARTLKAAALLAVGNRG